jgi:hypothetical protein
LDGPTDNPHPAVDADRKPLARFFSMIADAFDLRVDTV